jgi:DNA-binding MarR family transcriptional regulator
MNEDSIRQLLATAVEARRAFPRGGFEGLEPNALQVLLALALRSEQSVGELAESLRLQHSTVSHALSELRQQNLATGRVSDQDGRRQVLQLTRRGKGLVDRFVAQAVAPDASGL